MKGASSMLVATKLSLAARALLSIGVVVAGTRTIVYYVLGAELGDRRPAALARPSISKDDGASDSKAAFSISIDGFRQLSSVDQRKILAGAFEHRLEHAKNIQYRSELRW